jgi:hypothetical protein
MIFNVQVIPISQEPLSVSATAKPVSGPMFLCVGFWNDIRGFIARYQVGALDFADVEGKLHSDHHVSFDIDISESSLAAAGFKAVKKLE